MDLLRVGSLFPTVLSLIPLVFKTSCFHVGPKDQSVWHGAQSVHYSRKVKSESVLNCIQLCETPWILPGSSVHGILQATVLEWVALLFSSGFSWVPYFRKALLAGGCHTWGEVLVRSSLPLISSQCVSFVFYCGGADLPLLRVLGGGVDFSICKSQLCPITEISNWPRKPFRISVLRIWILSGDTFEDSKAVESGVVGAENPKDKRDLMSLPRSLKLP